MQLLIDPKKITNFTRTTAELQSFFLFGLFCAGKNSDYWRAIIGACGTAVAAIYCFVHPPIPKPFMHIYSHDDWVFDPEIVHFPKLLIRATDHRMGKRPRLEFMQGDYVFPWESDSNGNITIIRNNHSIGRFADLGVVIRPQL